MDEAEKKFIEREFGGACLGVISGIEEIIRKFNQRLDDPIYEPLGQKRIEADECLKKLKEEWLRDFKDKVGMA